MRPAKLKLSVSGKLAYASGSIGTGVFSTVPTVLLLYFCTEIIGIQPGFAALIVLLPKIWSIIWDPFVGAWSDRHQGRFGRRRPFLLLGNIGVAISFIWLFTPPDTSVDVQTAWIALGYFLLVTTYSIFAVPYIALPAEIAVTTEARRQLVAWRIAFGLTGVLVGASFAPYLAAWFGGGQQGYSMMAVAVAVLCAVMMLGPFIMMRGREQVPQSLPTIPVIEQIRIVASIGPFRRLCLSYFFQVTAVGVLTSALPYIVTKILRGSEEDIGTALGMMMGTAIVSIWVWTAASKRKGERAALCAAAILLASSVAVLATMLVTEARWEFVMLAIGFAGLAFAGIQVLPFTLLANFAHEHSSLGNSSEATMTGVWAATEKLGLAIGPAITAMVLATANISTLPVYICAMITLLLLASLPLVPASATHRAKS